MSMWFFAPPRAWTRLPLAVAVLVDVLRDRVEPTNRKRFDVVVVEQRVDRLLVAVHDVRDAPGSRLLPAGDEVDAPTGPFSDAS